MENGRDLRGCEGFVALLPAHGCGVVDRVLCDEQGKPAALAIRVGLHETHRVTVGAPAVAELDRGGRLVILRSDWREWAPEPPPDGQQHEPTWCTLQQAVGRLEPCPRSACALWSSELGCSLAPLEAALLREPDAARLLLRVREQLGPRANPAS